MKEKIYLLLESIDSFRKRLNLSRPLFALILIGIFFSIDALYLTPTLLQNSSFIQEANPVHKLGFEKFGPSYIYFSYPFFLATIFFVMKGGDKICNLTKYTRFQNLMAFYGVTFFSVFITMSCVVNNSLIMAGVI